MAEAQVIALREALQNQSAILEILNAEIEEERKAMSYGVDEVLLMITRLQEEKAREKMEACQYKRMAEMKLRHAQECLVEKEVEIAYLKYQVLDWKHQLLSVVLKNIDVDLMRMTDYQWIRRAGTPLRDASLVRNISLPATQSEKADVCIRKTKWMQPSPLSQTHFEQLKKQMQQLEDDMTMKQEDIEKGREQLQLLMRIIERLDTTKWHINNNPKFECHKKDDSPIDKLCKGILHCFPMSWCLACLMSE